MLKLHKEFPDRIYEGLTEIKRLLRRSEWTRDPKDVYFYRHISAADVDNFASLINHALE
jgi:hypothetical protein